MIGNYTLMMLCDKYNINSENLVNKNNNILDKGEYEEIDRTLNYLVNILKISSSNIEKCPSILYRNVNEIEKNILFLQKQNIHFNNIETCLHVLSSENVELIETYNYVEKNYGVNSINKTTSILSCNKNIIIDVEKLNLDKDWNLTIAVAIGFGITKIEDIQKMLHSDEYKEHPELFTSTTLAHAKIEDIQKILHSEEYKEHPEMFTSTTLAQAKIEDIQKILHSEEYKEHPELFTSIEFGITKIEDIQKILHSEEYKEHPELFTSTTLAQAKIEDIQKILHSEEYKEHPELFTSQTLAFAKIEDIQKMLHSEEYKEHPEMFTSTTIAFAKIEDIQKILHSEEYKEHPELFTSETLAHAKIEDIQKILHSEEYKEHPELFTSSILAKSKSMITKLPILFAMARQYEIEKYINTSFLLFSPSQNYALINYLIDNNLALVIDGKLNPIFGKQPGLLKSKYNIDIKELIKMYPFENYEKKENKSI